MIYLDNAATTPMIRGVFPVMKPWIDGTHIGNPSSLHAAGREAKCAIGGARSSVAYMLGASRPDEIIFTSGGTESDNIAILGMVPYLKQIGRTTIILSAIEHHAVLNLQHHLSNAGMTVYILKVNQDGIVDTNTLQQLLNTEPVGLVSIMLANNEIGVIQPITVIANMCHKHYVTLHTDAVQAVGHMKIDVGVLGVDMLSLSGHKFGAPDGIGALYVSQHVKRKLSPMFCGGGQEMGLRPGTENVAAIVGLGAAAERVSSELKSMLNYYEKLRYSFLNGLTSIKHSVKINSNNVECLPNILSIEIDGVGAEALLLLMDSDGVCISAASACSAGSLTPSHVLTSIGRSSIEAQSTIRVSFGLENDEYEAYKAANILSKNVERLKKMYS